MSTWICDPPRRPGTRRLALGLIAILSTGACDEGAGGLGIGLGFAPPAGNTQLEPGSAVPLGRPLKTVALADGQVVLSGPDGYCIDGDSVTSAPGRGFAVLASCEVLSGGEIGAAVDPVILTVSIVPAEGRLAPPEAKALAQLLAPVRLLDSIQTDSLTLAHLATGGTAVSGDGDPRHWRGALVLNDHLVVMALYAAKGSPLAGSAGQVLLRQIDQRLRKGSPVRGSATTPQPETQSTGNLAE